MGSDFSDLALSFVLAFVVIFLVRYCRTQQFEIFVGVDITVFFGSLSTFSEWRFL